MSSNLVIYSNARMALEADGCFFSDVSNFNQQPIFQPIHNYLAHSSRCEEALLDSLVKSEELAYAINQFRLPIVTPVGQSLYDFLCCISNHHLIGGLYESSVLSLAFFELLEGIGARNYPWRRQPLRGCANHEVDEMSLANYLVIELRKLLSSRCYKTQLQLRKKAADQQYLAAKSIFDKQLRSDVAFSIFRFDFISPSESGFFIQLSPDSVSGWTEFLMQLNLWMVERSHFTYIWRREFITQIGYRYHLIVIANSNARYSFTEINEVLGKMWRTSTKNTRAYIANPIGHRIEGSCEVAAAICPGAVHKVLQSLRIMLNGEVLGRLAATNGQTNWGSKSFPALHKKQAPKGRGHV